MRFESSVNAADLPAPRPPQISTLPFRRNVFSAFPRRLSIETLCRSDDKGGSVGGVISGISRPRVIAKSSGVRGWNHSPEWPENEIMPPFERFCSRYTRILSVIGLLKMCLSD